MNRLRLLRRSEAEYPRSDDHRIIRRFFALIQRLERPFRKDEAEPAPEVKARITALGDDTIRSN